MKAQLDREFFGTPLYTGNEISGRMKVAVTKVESASTLNEDMWRCQVGPGGLAGQEGKYAIPILYPSLLKIFPFLGKRQGYFPD
jgi:hypothetical protein